MLYDSLEVDKPIIFFDEWLTKSDLISNFASLQEKIIARNIGKNDVIAIAMHRRAQVICNFLGLINSNITIVPLNPDMPKADFEETAKIAGANWLLMSEDDLIKLNDVATFPELPSGIRSMTSGTTSLPKCVHHSYASLFKNAKAFNNTAGLGADTILHHVMPIHYMAGYLNTIFCPLIAGGSVIFDDNFSPILASNFGDNVIKMKPNTIWLSPSMLMILCMAIRDDKHSKNVTDICCNLFVGTAPLLRAQKDRFEEKFNVTCRQSYGMTETMFVSVQEKDAETHNVGKIIEDVELYLEKDTNEICIASDYVKPVIFAYDEQKSNYLENNAPFFSGDVGAINNDELEIVGRIKDLIIKGGVNISPSAIEEIMLKFSAVKQVAIMGVESEFWGEDIVAFVSLDDEASLEGLKGYVAKSLDKNLQPSRYILVDSFEVTPTGKIKKLPLEQMLA